MYADTQRLEREVKMTQDVLMGARLVDPTLAPRTDPWLAGYVVDGGRLAQLEQYIRTCDADWNPKRFVDEGIERLERIFGHRK